jgi:hypothetical protein
MMEAETPEAAHPESEAAPETPPGIAEPAPAEAPPIQAPPIQAPRAPWRARWGWLTAIVLVGLGLRALYVLWIHPIGDFLYSDMEGHYHAGLAFADPRHVFGRWDIVKPRAMGFIGGFILSHFRRDGLQVWGGLQVLLSTATLPLTFVFVRRFFGRRTALLATALLAIDYLPIGFAGFLMTETYLMFFLALAAALLVPENPLLCLLSGAAIGLGCLFKPQALPLLLLWGLVLLVWPPPGWTTTQGPKKRTLADWLAAPQRLSAILLLVGGACAVLPESMAVSRINGHPTLLTPYGGQNFYIGHCNVMKMDMNGSFFAGVPKVYQRNEPWPDVAFHVPVFDSAFYVQEGLKCYERSFWASVLWTLEQLADCFAGWPGSTIDPWPIPQGWNSITRPFNLLIGYVFFPLALVMLWRRRRDLGAWLGFGAPLASIWGLAVIFSGDPRYREPFDLFIVAGGSFTLLRVWKRWALPRILQELAKRAAPRLASAPAAESPAPESVGS